MALTKSKLYDKLRTEELGDNRKENDEENEAMLIELEKIADCWMYVSLKNTRKSIEDNNLTVIFVP